jgi:hypothetical protein
MHLLHKVLYVSIQFFTQLLVATEYLFYLLVGLDWHQIKRRHWWLGIDEGGLANLGEV